MRLTAGNPISFYRFANLYASREETCYRYAHVRDALVIFSLPEGYTVSYTHLDVYKRQRLNCSIRTCRLPAEVRITRRRCSR